MTGEPYRNHLPHLLLSDEILSALSLDAYIYYLCGACGMYLGLNPALITDRADILRQFACPVCGMHGHLTLNVFPFKSLLECDDCGRRWGELTTGFFFAPACGNCGSKRNTQVKVEPLEPLPAVFADRGDARLWGKDAAADARAIQDAVAQNGRGHDRLRYLIPAALFAERLYTWNGYQRDRWILRMLQGSLLHQYFKAVRLESAGTAAVDALAGLAEGPDAPDRPAGMADLCNETAYACYSLLRVAGTGMSFDLELVRETGSRIGRKAIAAYAEVTGVDPALVGSQVARTWFLIGDICRTRSFGATRLQEAIACYDRALGEAYIPADVREWVNEARDEAVRELDLIRGAEPAAGQRAPVDYGQDDWPSLSAENRCEWYRRAATQLEEDGNLAAAEEALNRAQTIALNEFKITPDVGSLRLQAHMFARVFDDAAHLVSRS